MARKDYISKRDLEKNYFPVILKEKRYKEFYKNPGKLGFELAKESLIKAKEKN